MHWNVGRHGGQETGAEEAGAVSRTNDTIQIDGFIMFLLSLDAIGGFDQVNSPAVDRTHSRGRLRAAAVTHCEAGRAPW